MENELRFKNEIIASRLEMILLWHEWRELPFSLKGGRLASSPGVELGSAINIYGNLKTTSTAFEFHFREERHNNKGICKARALDHESKSLLGQALGGLKWNKWWQLAGS